MTGVVGGSRRRSSDQGVVAEIMGRVVVERRSARGDGDRVAVLAHFSRERRVSKSLASLAWSFADRGYRVVVCSAAQVAEPLGLPDGLGDQITVLRKPNVGYDFGSWAVAQAWDPSIRRAKHVVLANDSLAGPFHSLRDILGVFESSRADVLGLTNTTQFRPHLQSYFLGFNGGVLAERPIVDFWERVRHERDRIDVIHRNEIGFGTMLRRGGFSQDAVFPYWKVVDEGLNPTIRGWRGLLEIGFPFVKREILRTPEVAPEGHRAPLVLKQMFGVDVKEWL